MMRESSSGVAPCSTSSTGSMPTRLSRPVAAESNSLTTGPTTARYASVDPARNLATGSGLAMPRFFGASSPKTICTTVATKTPAATETPVIMASGRPASVSHGRTMTAIAGSARKPTSSAVTVMPSWAPESMKDKREVTCSAFSAAASPAAACSRSRERSAATKANSWATK